MKTEEEKRDERDKTMFERIGLASRVTAVRQSVVLLSEDVRLSARDRSLVLGAVRKLTKLHERLRI
jgi:hypothetical protein